VGIDKASVRIMLAAREAGASFDRVLTIGRQQLRISQSELPVLLKRHGVEISAATVANIFTDASGYGEPLWQFLGARKVDSLDISAFEGASILHDMNKPLPEELSERFTFVFDGGSIEHIFHYPLALKNCMQALSVGGHLITVTPANNLMGHGFYQLSPELFFRTFSRINGFEIVKILLYEYPWKSAGWYEVADPECFRSRVVLKNRRRVHLIAWAKRIASVPIFEQPPQQSDYVAAWKRAAEPSDVILQHDKRPFYRQYAPAWIKELYLAARPFGRSYYKKVEYD
jgi:hypothetical protein